MGKGGVPIAAATRGRGSDARAALWKVALIAAALGTAAPALAMSLKSIMGEMSDTTKQSKRLLAGTFALADARAILRAYAQQAGASQAFYAGASDARAQDLRERFLHLANIAAASQASVNDKASFRRAFVAVVEDCRSCHDVYK